MHLSSFSLSSLHHEPGAKGVTWKGVYGPKNQRQLCTDFSKKVCSVVRELKPGIHKGLEGRGGGGNESEIVHEKKNGQGKKEGGRREVEGGEELLQVGDKIGNV